MCCGVGNLSVAIARAVPAARVWASDVTEACVRTTRRNIVAHDLSERVAVCRGDLFEALAGLGLEGSIDLVVCNPPYISSGRLATDRAHLLADEPRRRFSGTGDFAHTHQVVRIVPGWQPIDALDDDNYAPAISATPAAGAVSPEADSFSAACSLAFIR